AFTNTNTAAATALVAWACLDLFRTGKVTAVGAATGLVVGLVGITPAAGYITAPASLAVGALSALVSYTAIQIRSTTRLDASLGAKAGVREQLSGLDLSEHGEEAYFGGEQGALAGAGVAIGEGVIVSRMEAEGVSGAAAVAG